MSNTAIDWRDDAGAAKPPLRQSARRLGHRQRSGIQLQGLGCFMGVGRGSVLLSIAFGIGRTCLVERLKRNRIGACQGFGPAAIGMG